MRIPTDKIYHVVIGLMALVCLWVCYWLSTRVHAGAAAAFATTAMGVGLEAYQWQRKEGTPNAWDALATAAPGWVVWAVLATGVVK